ncbi:nuclear transport factor 2 family protein [Jongsikchunia kroppenstedtii]|uniref:nuclear transport factor 2 family protein n=1 Tax=Jongsikchunia kroppenstedtii TaxID=1121721 RepID=UPI000371C384|nr:nuclear transport factor 2 family protein [Jongsikchunia kroppenstedtii]
MTPEDLVDIAEITALKYRYGRSLDNRLWDEFGSTLAPNVKANYGSVSQGRPLVFDSRDAVVEYLSSAMSGSLVSEHRFSQPEITVEGDTATGTWALSDIVIMPDSDTLVTGSAFYTDRYERGPDGWQITETSYYRMYESAQSMKAMGFMLLSNRFAQ